MQSHSQVRRGVFISYSRADGEHAAHRLHARLAKEAPDIPAWLDRFEIEGGVGWWNQIEHELDRAEFLLLIMTPTAAHSENTRREWRSARQRGVCVYPVKCAPDEALEFSGLPNWMRKAHFYDPELEWPKLINHLRRGCRATRVPFMAPDLPPSFVARPREIDRLIESSLNEAGDPRAATTALRGPGGFGKTTLAIAFCHDNRCLDAFDDGILWVTLGPSPNQFNELVKLYAALTGERPAFVDVEDATRELAIRLEHKSCLIVIDDVWRADDVAPFFTAARGCARLITTRLLEATSGAQRVDIARLTPPQALELLIGRAGIGPNDPDTFRTLSERLGYWPLPIKLAGSALRQRLERGDTLDKATGYLVRALDKRGIVAFDSGQPAKREDAVASTIRASLDLLEQEEQRRCAELTVFHANEPIPLALAAGLWALDELDGEDLARKLDDFSLIEFDIRLGTIQLHQELRSFLAGLLPDSTSVHSRVIEEWGDRRNLRDSYRLRHYPHHLRGAGVVEGLRSLLLDPDWLEQKATGAGVHSLFDDFRHCVTDPVLDLLRDALRLSVPSLAKDPGQLRA